MKRKSVQEFQQGSPGNGSTGQLVAIPQTVSPDVRLRRVHSMSDLLPGLGVRVTPAEDGRLSVSLPAEMAELFLVDLEHRAKEWEFALRKARIEEIRRQVELEAATGEALRECREREDGWLLEYEKLRKQGKGHREALNIIRGPKDREALCVTSIELGIVAARGRRRRQQREARKAEVLRLVDEGRSTQGIADALGIDYQTVRSVLRSAGAPVRDARHDQRGAMGAIRHGNGRAELS